MDRTTGKKGTDAAASKTRSKQKVRKSAGAQGEKRAPRTAKKSEGTPQPCGDGSVAPLADLAVKELGAKGTKLTRGVVIMALQGNNKCTKFVHSLLEETKTAKQSEPDKVEISQASLWGAEPEWNGELTEQAGETCSGRLEPEN